MTSPSIRPEKIEELIGELLFHAKRLEKNYEPARAAVARQAAVTIQSLKAENERLLGLINTPQTGDWFAGVRFEAGHQIERFGAEHDAGKSPMDWFWLIGYLAQKAAMSQIAGDDEKAQHHTISTAAALLNWHRNISGESRAMRPGIETPMPSTQNTGAPNHADGTRRATRRKVARAFLTAQEEK